LITIGITVEVRLKFDLTRTGDTGRPQHLFRIVSAFGPICHRP
jgi:hypothetical protein